MCPHCRAFITIKDRVCPYCNEEVAPRRASQDDASQLVGGFIPAFRFNTTMILLLNFGLYAATTLFSMNSGNTNSFFNLDVPTLVRFGAKWNLGLVHGEWWRLITAGFLHGGILHILMNSWVLFDLGAQVEELFGSSRMLVIYFLATVGGFYASAVWSPAVSVGASAGLFGMVGAMIAFGMRHHGAMGATIRAMYLRGAVIGLAFGCFKMFHVDNAAHVGGLAAGFAVAYVAGTPGREGLRENLWRIASWCCVLITAVSFLKMYLWFAASTQ
jgi:rhomboid protease GluP